MSLWNSLHGLFGPPTSKSKSRGKSRRPNRRGSSFQPRFESLEDRALLSAVTGDFNHDGIADLAIGVPGQETNGVAAGAVHRISMARISDAIPSASLSMASN